MADSETVVLTDIEIRVLTAAASCVELPVDPVRFVDVRRVANEGGVTAIGFTIGLRRLIAKEFLMYERASEQIEHDSITVTEVAWDWMQLNEAKFELVREDDLPPIDPI